MESPTLCVKIVLLTVLGAEEGGSLSTLYKKLFSDKKNKVTSYLSECAWHLWRQWGT